MSFCKTKVWKQVNETLKSDRSFCLSGRVEMIVNGDCYSF